MRQQTERRMSFIQSQRAASVTAWVKRREKKGEVVTADDLIARIKRCWPAPTEAEIDDLYQACA